MTVGIFYLRFFYEKSRGNIKNFITFAVANRGVAQLAARHVRDVEVGSSSLLTPTEQKRIGLSAGSLDLFHIGGYPNLSRSVVFLRTSLQGREVAVEEVEEAVHFRAAVTAACRQVKR